MSTVRTLSPEILRASKKAANYQYDTSKYAIVNTKVKRDSDTGRLMIKEETKK